MNLEMLLSSACRRKILKAQRKVRSTNVMELVRQVDSTYSQVNPNLKILETEGIVIDEYLGRMRIIKLNKKNPKTERLLEALRILEKT
jgi:DNA-binding transcriptional ArsR family regulator